MLRSDNRILTTHAGSLPRPASLTELYARRSRGEPVDASELRSEGLAALRHVVARQIEAGIDIINDGEQQREGFFLYVQRRMSGFGAGWTRRPFADMTRYPGFAAWKTAHDAVGTSISNIAGVPEAIGEIRYLDPGAIERDCADFAAALSEQQHHFAETFLTAPSPGIVALAMRNRFYPDRRRVSKRPGRSLARRIRRHRQGRFRPADRRSGPGDGASPDVSGPAGQRLRGLRRERVIAVINRALTGIAPDRVRLHACWGNYEGPHDSDVALQEILPTILQARVGAFVLPFANPRHAHEYRVLASAPLRPDQCVVAGVIDVLTNFVEHPEVVADRIEHVAEALGDPHRVLAGTDCGFDTSAGRGRVAEDVVWAKLAALAEGARLASRRLFA